MIIHKVEGLWEVTGHESEVPFAVDLLLHEVPICLLSSNNESVLPSLQNDEKAHLCSL